MTFRLEAEESLASGLERVAEEEIARARDALRDERDPETGVHEARKSLKKVRAVLRLSRKPLGKRLFRDENRRFRDLARRLAAQRAAVARLATLDGVVAGLGGTAPLRLLRASRRRLVPRRRRYDDAAIRAAVSAALVGARPEISDALDGRGFSSVRYGLERTYRKGRKRMRAAREAPSADAFHEWRKRVKDLWYQVRLFRSAWPDVLGSLADELHLLSDHLGDGHDLDLLESALREEAATDPLFDPAPLLAAVDRAREEERAAALALGRRLYAEEPAAFVARIESYWRTWGENGRPAG